MQQSLTLLLGLVCVSPVFGAAVFHWPDPAIDSMDEMLYMPFVSAVSTFALNCGPRDNSTIAAQWLRIAYHDAATHDRVAGTGGMDASIVFEYNRPQNIGRGMLETLADFVDSPNEHVGMADVIAMGAINAVVGCGGPIIPFRGGRIDATEAGPATVPEPQQDLASHTAAFARQGFNATEMISGVRQADFPLIVTDEVPSGVQTFTSTIGFDNTLVTEYLDSTTQDVLVVGSNITTRSDLRIFSSDGNATMQSMTSSDAFNQICADLIGRMIELVPSTVTLTDTIEPIDFKVWDTLLFPQGGSLAFLATLRIIDSDPGGCSAPAFQVSPSPSSFLASLKGVTGYTMHSFNASIDLATSISYFWFEVDNNDGSAPFIVDNQGTNFTINQDVLLFDPRRSFFALGISQMVVAVKDSSGSVNVTSTTLVQGTTTVPVSSTVTTLFQLDSAWPPADGYTFYSASLPDEFSSNTLHTTVNGTAYSQWVLQLDAPGV
ncbi:Peroxidase [Mycena sanguinolenta]|uniref:Peroxidase n=1 Tax=Mycena sanguinolenta TaxID=230812 RepID=A0A8H6ZGB4_9AGAR|nr:Peroxidase [Mycena sanguinolenta]